MGHYCHIVILFVKACYRYIGTLTTSKDNLFFFNFQYIWFSNRSFYVIPDEKSSQEYKINVCVTQGCILAPALFPAIDS